MKKYLISVIGLWIIGYVVVFYFSTKSWGILGYKKEIHISTQNMDYYDSLSMKKIIISKGKMKPCVPPVMSKELPKQQKVIQNEELFENL